jgi:hypothetical protein
MLSLVIEHFKNDDAAPVDGRSASAAGSPPNRG